MMEQISRSIYAETRAKCITIPFGEAYFVDRGSNPCCVISDRGIVQIDTTKNPMYAIDWISSVRAKSDKEFKYTINTDHHLDHIMCNYCFSVPVITHYLTDLEVKKFENFEPQKLIPFMYSKELYNQLVKRDDSFITNLMKSFMELEDKFRAPYENLRIMAANITFDKKITLKMGNLTIELLHVGGHAVGSTLVYVPEEKVLFAGDSVFNDLLPNMTQANTSQWLDVISMIEKMDIEVIVPGHGHPCDKRVLKKLREYIQTVRDRVQKLQMRGNSREEVISQIDLTSFFPVNDELGWTKERIQSWSSDNIGRVFDEFKQMQ